MLRFSEVFSFCVKRYDFVVILLFDLSRWGPQLEQAGSKTQRLYLSEQVSLLLFLWFVHFFLMKNIQSLFTAPYVYRFFLVLSLDEWQCA